MDHPPTIHPSIHPFGRPCVGRAVCRRGERQKICCACRRHRLGCSTAKKQQRLAHPPRFRTTKPWLLFAYQSTLVVTGGCRQTGIKISKAAAPQRAAILATLIAAQKCTADDARIHLRGGHPPPQQCVMSGSFSFRARSLINQILRAACKFDTAGALVFISVSEFGAQFCQRQQPDAERQSQSYLHIGAGRV